VCLVWSVIRCELIYGVFILEHSLRHSKHRQLTDVVSGRHDDSVNINDRVRDIAAVKKVNVNDCPQ